MRTITRYVFCLCAAVCSIDACLSAETSSRPNVMEICRQYEWEIGNCTCREPWSSCQAELAHPEDGHCPDRPFRNRPAKLR